MQEIKYSSKIQTHERIKKSLVGLLAEEQKFEDISVAEIAKRAEITRGTFYTHFNDIFEVAEELENDYISELKFSGYEEAAENFPIFLREFFEYLTKNESLYQQLISSDKPMVFASHINTKITEIINVSLPKELGDRFMKNLDISFFADGATYMIVKYFRKEISPNLDEIEWYLVQHFMDTFLDY